MKRNFAEWLLTFTDSIANYKYYIDFETIYKNAEEHKIELNMLNSLIGCTNIEYEFEKLVNKYPEVLKCIPTLLAVRQYEIIVLDDDGCYSFSYLIIFFRSPRAFTDVHCSKSVFKACYTIHGYFHFNILLNFLISINYYIIIMQF